jgi:hypothetical protein
MLNVWGKFFIDGNVMEGNANVTNDNWTDGVYAQISSSYGISQTTKDTIRLSDPLPTGVVTTHTAQKAYDQVLLYAGCSLFRDDIDKRIISETQNQTFTLPETKGGYHLPLIIHTNITITGNNIVFNHFLRWISVCPLFHISCISHHRASNIKQFQLSLHIGHRGLSYFHIQL